MAQTLHVRINSPEKLLWEGEAEWVASENVDGPFSILPQHANFITFIENKVIKINTGGQVVDYTFPHSVLYTHANKVYIYTNI